MKRLIVLSILGAALMLLALAPGAPPAHAQQAIPGRIIAQSGDAYIAYDENAQTWEIGTQGISRRMDYDVGGGLRLTSLKHKLTDREWLAPKSGTSSELRIGLEGQLIVGSAREFALRGYTTHKHPDGSLELEVILLRGPLAAYLHYVVYPRTSILSQWAVVENTGTTTMRDLIALDSISVALRPSAEALTLYWVQGLTPPDQNKSTPRNVPTLRLRSVRLSEGVQQVVGSSARSSEDSMGWFALAAPSLREGVFGGIEWSGAWQLRAVREGGQTSLHAGIEGIRHNIKPGERFEAPRRFFGFYSGDLDNAANASHEFARSYLLRPRPADFPWTQYNTWFAYYTDLEEVRLRREVDNAAALGLEAFVVDAGWYEGSPSHADFSFGLGTWKENREKFPSGLAAFSDYVHEKGLRFGLWVEPERVDLRYVGSDKEIPPEWLAPGTAFDATPPEGSPQTAQICLGHRAAREWMKGWLARLVRDYRLDWLKWDNNIWMSCDPPGQAGDGNYAHVQGLYEVFDFLRREFPNLIIENCASGGNRMDFALMRRTDIAWLSDQTDPSYRVRYHVFGASYPFPPEYLNSWLVESYFEHLADVEDNPPQLRAWLRSRMMGAFGISLGTLGLSSALLERFAIEIELYKSLRDVVVNGKHYHLLPQSDLSEPDLVPPTEPDAAAFYDPLTDRAVVFLFAGQVPWTERRVRLKGLNRATSYQVTSADGQISTRRTGAQLMNTSLRFPYVASHPSTVLILTPERSYPAGNIPRLP